MYRDLQEQVHRLEEAPLMTRALKQDQAEAAHDAVGDHHHPHAGGHHREREGGPGENGPEYTNRPAGGEE